MEDRNSRKNTGLLIFLIAAITIITIVNNTIPVNRLKKYGVYERAYVIDREGAKGGVKLTYTFTHQGKTDTLSNVMYRTDIEKGDSFFYKNNQGAAKRSRYILQKLERRERVKYLITICWFPREIGQ